MRKSLAGILGLTLMACAAPSIAQNQAVNKTVPFAPGGTLRIENVNGSIEIRGWDRPEVQVHAVKSATRSSDLDKIQVNIQAARDRVAIQTVYPEDEGVDAAVEYMIRVPRRVVLELASTVNGAVRVSGVEGSGELRTVNGDVSVTEAGGGFSARTTNGSIREELESFAPKPVSLETMNGSVFLALPPNAGADVDAQSMNGEIRTAEPVMLDGAFGHGSFRGKLGVGGSPLRIRTVNGAIEIAVWSSTV